MKVILCITRDLVTGEAVTSPQIFRSVLEAERNWGMAMRQESANPSVPVKDFQLYKVGDFDTETLVITPDVQFLHNAVEFLSTSSVPVTPVVKEEVKKEEEVTDGIHDNV